MVVALIAQLGGCIFGDCLSILVVRARLVDVDTGAPLTDALVGGRTFAEGQVTSSAPALGFGGNPVFLPPDENGAVEIRFDAGSLMLCPPPPFPPLDQVEIVVIANGCEQRFLLDVNAATVVDVDFPGGVLEFVDPISVPLCQGVDVPVEMDGAGPVP